MLSLNGFALVSLWLHFFESDKNRVVFTYREEKNYLALLARKRKKERISNTFTMAACVKKLCGMLLAPAAIRELISAPG